MAWINANVLVLII